ncbi:MAG: (d)CMP kinase, partial [Mycoplasmatales bacterium]
LNINYLDTGAMYRVVTLFMLENDIEINNEKLVEKKLKDVKIDIFEGEFYLNSKNVNIDIRKPEISKNVSMIASYNKVRQYLVKEQQLIGTKSSCILDGRDIGSVVFPNADYKFFLTASPETRARRRFLENENSDFAQKEEEILKEIIKRDKFDSTRKESPLLMVSDAFEIDSSNLNIQEVVSIITKKVK